MSNERWKAARVFVNNAPDQWHVRTGKWGEPSIAVCDTEEHAKLMACAPEMLERLNMLFNIATHPKATKDQIRMIANEARPILAKAEGRG